MASSLISRIQNRKYWYHKISLPGGYVTPGFDLEPIWDNIRNCLDLIPHQNKRVLDIAAFDGLWSFYAEKLGALEVIAADCIYSSFTNILLCREALESDILPYYNVSPYKLTERLDVYLQENYENQSQYDRLFDIVYHFGLFYHLRDPMLSLMQARSVIRDGGTLVFESEVLDDIQGSSIVYNGIPEKWRIRNNHSVWFAPTTQFLKEALKSCFFELDESSLSIVNFEVPTQPSSAIYERDANFPHNSKRVVLKATAFSPGKFDSIGDQFLCRELLRDYRNPGLDRLHPDFRQFI